MDLQEFESELKAQHASLTAEYEKAHALAEKTWAEYEAVKSKVVEFRGKYGKVLRALADVKVEG